MSDFVFLFRAARDAGAVLDRQRRALLAALNYQAEDLVLWSSIDGSMAVAQFRRRTGLYGIAEQACIGDETATLLKGHIVAKRDDGAEVMAAADVDARLRRSGVDVLLAESSGDFAVCKVDAGESRAVFFNDLLSMVSLFYADTDPGQVVVATRPRLIQSLLPEWDFNYESLAWQAAAYWPIGEETLVRQIRRSPQGARIVVEHGRLRVIGTPLPYLAANQADSERAKLRAHPVETLNRVLDRMAHVIEAIVAKAPRADLAITGGKDSRAIAALVTTRGITSDKIHCFTSGVMEHPDVVVAGLITKLLGCRHQVNIPGRATYSARSILQGRLAAIFRYDGMLPSWDGTGATSVKDGVLLQGHVGEVYRDKWFQSTYASPADFARRMFIHSVDPNGLLRPEARAAFLKQLQVRAEWYLDNGVTLDLMGGVFRVEGMQSWESAGFSQGALWSQHAVHPLYDPDLVRLSFLVDRSWRDDERIHFEIIRRSGFNLAEVPFAGQRWHAGLKEAAGDVRIDMAPIESVQSLVSPSGWQAGLFFSSPLQRAFLAMLDSVSGSPLWDYFDRDAAISAITKADPSISGLRMTRIYSLLTSMLYAHGFELPVKFRTLPEPSAVLEHRSLLRTPAGEDRIFDGKTRMQKGAEEGLPVVQVPGVMIELLEASEPDVETSTDLYDMFGKLRSAALENASLRKRVAAS